MRRLLPWFLATVLVLSTAGCKRSPSGEPNTLRVGASPVPHAIILEHVKPQLAQEGIKLQIVELTDYVQPNLALAEGELEANFFQHQPYLDQFNADRGTRLVSAGKVHVEPLGVYSRRHASLEALPEGAVVAIPNDPTNAARALRLLETAGLLTLKKVQGLPTALDVAQNPRKLSLRELESAQLPRSLPDVDAAVINTNYVLEAGLDPVRDALAREGTDSPYANIVAVRPELLNDPRVVSLMRALHRPETQRFITERFQGAIVPVPSPGEAN
ncbi:MAG: MetQ/NlpA family ABC transporter substrate-binding protein [Myxococcaceae bacterium]